MQSKLKVNVLLVDDRPENLLALEATLNGLGQNLVKAASGKQALKCLLDQDFAVILLDVQMSEMDGFETAALIRQRERSRHTPIIFLTAFSDSEDLRSKGYALGAVDYLLKPIDPMILTSKVVVFVDLFKKNLEVQQQAAQLVAKNLEILKAEAARHQAEEANRIKDEFLAIVSHELRTPLNSILGWSQLLLTKKFDEARTTQALQTIAQNAKSQAQLIEDILDVSRLMQGKIRLDIQPIDAIAIIESVLESVQPLAEEKSIQLHVQLDQMAKTIAADAERLRQIIWNLLTNAIKFTPAGGQVEVRLEPVETPPEAQPQKPEVNAQLSMLHSRLSLAQITVTDTGVGIAPEFLPYIFDRFRQADSSSTRAQGGLGLGLAIVAQLVTLQHGKIIANSEGEGKGSKFTVCLPLATVNDGSSKFAPAITPESGEEPAALDRVQVLLVEDHYDSRIFIKTALEAAGASVIAVASAQAALNHLTHSTPNILVSDIAMPEMNGYELIRQIRVREQPQGEVLPAIAITAYAKLEDKAQALAAGFQMHVPKPVESDVLVSAIAKLVNDRSGVVVDAAHRFSSNCSVVGKL